MVCTYIVFRLHIFFSFFSLLFIQNNILFGGAHRLDAYDVNESKMDDDDGIIFLYLLIEYVFVVFVLDSFNFVSFHFRVFENLKNIVKTIYDLFCVLFFINVISRNH